jgi:hypothetical protein
MAAKKQLTPNPNHALAKGGGPKTGDLAADLTDDAVTAEILAHLQEQMRPNDMYGRPQSPESRNRAQQAYLAIRAGAQERANEHHANEMRAQETKIKAEAQIAEAKAKEAAAEAERVRLQLEAGRLQLEAEKVEVLKAQTVMDALERIASNPELRALLPENTVQALSGRLLAVAPSEARHEPPVVRPALTELTESTESKP